MLLTTGPAPAAPFVSASVTEYLTPLKSYPTRCMGLWESEQIGLGGKHWFYSEGLSEDNYFTMLDVLTGECHRAGSLPRYNFDPVAVSDAYVIARDGLYNRHSVYTRSDWQRHGTLRLKDYVSAALILGDIAYLIQAEDTADGGSRPIVTQFRLPDMKFVKSTPLEIENGSAATTVGQAFAFLGENKLSIYDPVTGSIRSTGHTRQPEKQTKANCLDHVQPVRDRTLLVRVSCSSFLAYDVSSLQVRYEIELPPEVYFVDAFLAGSRLYINEHHDGEGPGFLRILDHESGREVARQPALRRSGNDYLFQVEDMLVLAVYDSNYPQKFNVQILKLDAGQ
jgi:hypothetical protein